MIRAIYISDARGAKPRRVHSAQLETGKGIVGDRNFDLSNWPGQNITFIELEEIERYNMTHGQGIEPWEVRRNVVTSGVRLNDLVGKQFEIGTARFVGVELCEPCDTVGEYLGNDSITDLGTVLGM